MGLWSVFLTLWLYTGSGELLLLLNKVIQGKYGEKITVLCDGISILPLFCFYIGGEVMRFIH